MTHSLSPLPPTKTSFYSPHDNFNHSYLSSYNFVFEIIYIFELVAQRPLEQGHSWIYFKHVNFSTFKLTYFTQYILCGTAYFSV